MKDRKDVSTQKEELPFEKARFQYCAELYKIEDEKQQRLESKSQFYLSFITVFLGAIFLNLEFLLEVRQIISNLGKSYLLILTVYFALGILAAGIIISVFSILQTVKVREHTNFYPEELTKELFSPNSEHIPDKNEIQLYRSNAMAYSLATEDKKRVNDRKAKWLHIAAVSLLITVFSLAVFLLLIFI